jgi:predicted RNA binding protein YcfA (HicA-like mRNA interferase family)
VKLPRDLSGSDLARALQVLGYRVTRQTGSHMRLTTTERGEHHVTVPAHDALRVGTLAGILGDVAAHFDVSREDLARRLFGAG